MTPAFLDFPVDILGVLQRLAVALGVGFIVGVERGWRQKDDAAGARAAGLRTFTLAGLYGGFAGLLGHLYGPLVLSAALLAFAAAFIAFELREGMAQDDFSATTAVAGLATMVLGVLAIRVSPTVIAAAAVALVGLLAFREALHTWLRKLTWPEIRSAVVLLAATFIIAPVLPAQAIDPWGVIEPRSLWWITVLLGAASFAGYVALRALPASSGLTVSALVGAIVSSTAVTLDMARRAKAAEAPARLAAGAALAASAVMLIRTSLLLIAIAPHAAGNAAPGIAAALVVFVGLAVLLHLGVSRDGAGEATPLGSPLDLKSVLRFAAVLACLTVISRLLGRFVGPQALLPFAAVAGFADLDAATLAIAQTRSAPAAIAGGAVLIAAASNTALKSGLALALGGRRFGAYFAGGSALAVIAAAAAWFGARALGYQAP